MAAARTVAKLGKLSERRSGIFERRPPAKKKQPSLAARGGALLAPYFLANFAQVEGVVLGHELCARGRAFPNSYFRR